MTPSANPIKAVSLDAAGTLIKVADPVAEVYARIAAKYDAELDLKLLGNGFRTHFPAMPPMAFLAEDEAARTRLERGWWRTLVRRVVSGAGNIDAFDEFFDDLYAHYAAPSAWMPYPEVLPLLEDLRAAGYRIAILSNFDSRLIAVLNGLDLTDRVDDILYSTRIGAAKPDPAAFAAVVTALGSPLEQCLHVGDDRKADLEGAQNAGLAVRFLDRRPKSQHNRKLPNIADLDELRPILGLAPANE